MPYMYHLYYNTSIDYTPYVTSYGWGQFGETYDYYRRFLYRVKPDVLDDSGNPVPADLCQNWPALGDKVFGTATKLVNYTGTRMPWDFTGDDNTGISFSQIRDAYNRANYHKPAGKSSLTWAHPNADGVAPEGTYDISSVSMSDFIGKRMTNNGEEPVRDQNDTEKNDSGYAFRVKYRNTVEVPSTNVGFVNFIGRTWINQDWDNRPTVSQYGQGEYMDKYWGYNIKDPPNNAHNWGRDNNYEIDWRYFDEEYMDLIEPSDASDVDGPYSTVKVRLYIRIPWRNWFYQFSSGNGTYNSPYIVTSNNDESWNKKTRAHIYYMVHGPGYVWIRAAVQSYYGYGGVWELVWSSYYNNWHWYQLGNGDGQQCEGTETTRMLCENREGQSQMIRFWYNRPSSSDPYDSYGNSMGGYNGLAGRIFTTALNNPDPYYVPGSEDLVSMGWVSGYDRWFDSYLSWTTGGRGGPCPWNLTS